ncbi:MAG: peptidoglycan DD-metalloendopeptidase family protein [Bacteroidales bacterium]|nr:peptidoglycan DD-metalloendopeptidase family protein [Bacteroidales bacterium]
MKHIEPIILLFALLALPVVVSAQTDEPQQKNNKSEIKVNKLDVIYEEEEYKGVAIDRRNNKETENYMYQAPFMYEVDEDDEEEEEDMPNIYTLDDAGADSEDEILIEGFDTAVIHLPKLDVNRIDEPIVIRLRDNARGEKFTWPTPWSARPSSHFGPRWRRWHYGLDLALPTGEPIYAAFDGVVRISKDNKSYGKLVIIHHANGLETYYAHMSKRNVVAGQQVKSGDIIGLCGNTGRSRGSHLHFEIRYMGNALNPENVVDCATHDLINDELSLTPSSFRKTAKGKSGSKASSSGGSSSGGWYRVRQGDTLEKIARRNGTTINQLCKLNGISRNKVLHPGDRLRVSGKASVSDSAPTNAKADSGKSSGSATYTVRKGDTLGKIAKAHGTTVKKLCQLNGISENKPIREGQKLKVK